MEISQDLGHKPIIFIRFNPDKYTSSFSLSEKEDQKKIPSCWKLNKNGLCVIFDEEKWQERLNCLANQIQYWIENKTEKTIEQIFLFYSNV